MFKVNIWKYWWTFDQDISTELLAISAFQSIVENASADPVSSTFSPKCDRQTLRPWTCLFPDSLASAQKIEHPTSQIRKLWLEHWQDALLKMVDAGLVGYSSTSTTSWLTEQQDNWLKLFSNQSVFLVCICDPPIQDPHTSVTLGRRLFKHD